MQQIPAGVENSEKSRSGTGGEGKDLGLYASFFSTLGLPSWFRLPTWILETMELTSKPVQVSNSGSCGQFGLLPGWLCFCSTFRASLGLRQATLLLNS